MKIVAGLGNPGAAYAGTRHNMGFEVIDILSEKSGISVDTRKHKALIGKGVIGGDKVILAKPQTYMNLSGESLREIMDYYKAQPEDLIVIYDDISLEPGQLRIRTKGSAGGHNGIKSILQHLGTEEFLRIKVGVGEKPPRMDLADYVLGRMGGEDREAVREAQERAAEAVSVLLEDGAEAAMNRYNAKKKA